MVFRLLTPLFLFLLLAACKPGQPAEKSRALARVHDEYLYEEALAGVVPPGTPAKDSTEIIANYIRDWIRQQLVVQQAEKNLPDGQKDFSRELQDYRNSLIVYQYERRLVQQKLDTLVDDKEIEDYYNANPDDFELKDNIVRVQYVKLRLKDPNLSTIRRLIRSRKDADRERLADLCYKAAANSYLDESAWLFFNDLLKEIPIKTFDQENYLQNHRFVEFQDEQFIYLVNILDFKIRESQSPLSMERGNIRNIILNKRKMNLIQAMEKEVMDQAAKNKSFEIF